LGENCEFGTPSRPGASRNDVQERRRPRA
jgi:hypothetical protein